MSPDTSRVEVSAGQNFSVPHTGRTMAATIRRETMILYGSCALSARDMKTSYAVPPSTTIAIRPAIIPAGSRETQVDNQKAKKASPTRPSRNVHRAKYAIAFSRVPGCVSSITTPTGRRTKQLHQRVTRSTRRFRPPPSVPLSRPQARLPESGATPPWHTALWPTRKDSPLA